MTSGEINGSTYVCGLIGNPVEHTMSPAIHNNLAKMLGINLAYLPFRVENGRLSEAVKGAYALNVLGMNVTVPYKSDVLSELQEIDPLAERIGAVNTLVRTEGGYKGYNTDMPGLYRAMVSDGVRIEDESVIILGAGGVARAVAVLLAEKRAAEIIMINRSVEKAEKIAEEVNGYAGRNLVKAMGLEEIDRLPLKQYLAIQATSVGLHPHDDEAVIDDKAFYSRIHTGYDLIFNPKETKFMKLVKAQGGQAYNGLKMLLYQGIIAFELWNQTSVSEEQAKEIYRILQK